jgi:hypothetical protein
MAKKRNKSHSAVIAAIAALIQPAWAETAPNEATLGKVVVTDQRDAQAERKNTPLQKIVIAEEEVERYGDATVGDVLRRLPGMSFTGPAGPASPCPMADYGSALRQALYHIVDGSVSMVSELCDTQVRDLVAAPMGIVAATKNGIWVMEEGVWRRLTRATPGAPTSTPTAAWQ